MNKFLFNNIVKRKYSEMENINTFNVNVFAEKISKILLTRHVRHGNVMQLKFIIEEIREKVRPDGPRSLLDSVELHVRGNIEHDRDSSGGSDSDGDHDYILDDDKQPLSEALKADILNLLPSLMTVTERLKWARAIARSINVFEREFVKKFAAA